MKALGTPQAPTEWTEKTPGAGRPIFASDAGTVLCRHGITRVLKKHPRRFGLPKTFRLYDLRHTCAALLFSRNVRPKHVQELLGHSLITLTPDTYSHVILGMDGGTASAMDEALG